MRARGEQFGAIDPCTRGPPSYSYCCVFFTVEVARCREQYSNVLAKRASQLGNLLSNAHDTDLRYPMRELLVLAFCILRKRLRSIELLTYYLISFASYGKSGSPTRNVVGMKSRCRDRERHARCGVEVSTFSNRKRLMASTPSTPTQLQNIILNLW